MLRWFESLIEVFASASPETPPRGVLAFYLFHLRPVWRVFAGACVAGLLLALAEVMMFGYLGQLIDLVNAGRPESFFRDHAGTLAWMVFVVLIARPAMLALHCLFINQAIAPSLDNRVRWLSHRHVVRQSLGFFQNDFAGRIANRVMHTGDSLRESAVQIVDAIWYVLIYTTSALVLFAEADLWLIAPLVAWLFVYVGILCYFVPRTKARSWRASEARSKLMGRLVDGYGNILTLKLFAHGEREDAYVADALREQVAASRSMTRQVTGMDTSISIVNGFLIVGTAALATWLWSRGAVSAGAIALSTGLTIRIHNMSGWIMWVVNGIFENIGTVQDGIETISQPRDIVDVPGAPGLDVRAGAVDFRDIHFHYGQRGGVISGLDLSIRAGEKIGLVGPSGAGKSTLVNLLLRLHDLEGGRIEIDGQDIAAVTQESLRCQVGMVTQDTSLLHRSIRDNLLYGRPDAGENALADAVRRARAEEFIPQLADGDGRRGYDAHVGERGVKLSGGQRQRIAIARVLLKDAPILVLDEATSALDSEAEAAIQDSLDDLMQGKTVIAIAHRLSTIARMDRLVVMDKGRIVESGTHAQLLARDGLYARLWARQTGGFVAAEAEAEA
jgi:ATP-binding cassette subfamily B multidrug efflux pump